MKSQTQTPVDIYALLEQNKVVLFTKAFAQALLIGSPIADNGMALSFALSIIRVFGNMEYSGNRMNYSIAMEECKEIKHSAKFISLCREQKVDYPIPDNIDLNNETHAVMNAAICISLFKNTALKIKAMSYAVETIHCLTGIQYTFTPWQWQKIS